MASKRSPSARSNPSAAASSQSTGLTSHAITMCDPSPPSASEQMELALMSSAAGSRVRISALADEKRAFKKELARVYGPKSCAWLSKFDPNTSLWRTSQISLLDQPNNQAVGSAAFLQTWPKAGSMRNGNCYQRPPLALHLPGSGYGSWPTPTARDHSGGRLPSTAAKAGRGAKNNLRDFMSIQFGWQYPPVVIIEYMMGFPIGWTDLEPSETP